MDTTASAQSDTDEEEAAEAFARQVAEEERFVLHELYAGGDLDEDECDGHESLAGQHMGEAVYCPNNECVTS